jgi:hypothetical protein
MKQKAAVDGIDSYGFPLTFYTYFGGKCDNCYDQYGFKLLYLLADIGIMAIIVLLAIRLKNKTFATSMLPLTRQDKTPQTSPLIFKDNNSNKMTPGEIYDFKRKNFIDKTTENFRYLVESFGYSQPTHKTSKQDNGVIILDEFQYENKLTDRLVTISNAYHPVDYGFEICAYRPSISTNHPDREMLIIIYKEKQDAEQAYIPTVAKRLKDEFGDILTGTKWVEK